MGDLLEPKPPQWQRREHVEDVPEDRVLLLTEKIWQSLHSEVDPTVVTLAAIRLVMKGIVGHYRKAVGHEAAKELVRQAAELADKYEVRGIEAGDDT